MTLGKLIFSSILLFARAQGSELHEAVRNCEVPQVEQLIETGVSLNAMSTGGETPLQEATRAGQPKCVYLLLEAGANRYLVSRHGETAHLIARKYPNGTTHDQMLTLFDNLNAVKVGPNRRAESLQYAALRGNVELATLMLELGTDPNVVQADGSTPLHVAALKGHAPVVRLLLEHGSEMKAFDGDGYTPLHVAVLGGSMTAVDELLKAGADVSVLAKNSGDAPLHLAASWNRLDVIPLLLKAGADRSVKDGRGRTPFEVAVANNYPEAAALLTPPQFEVASVKISQPFRQGLGSRTPTDIQVSRGSVTMRNVGLIQLITWAYRVSPQQIVNAPGRTSERYDILAKADTPASTDEMRRMMQSLLAERLKLEFHRESRRVSGFALVEAKGGHHLRKNDVAEGSGIRPIGDSMALRGEGATLAELAIFLSDPLGAPVVDLSRLSGRYDFTFDISGFITKDPGPDDPAPDPVAILQIALPKQLGLNIERRAISLQMLIIDNFSAMPVEN